MFYAAPMLVPLKPAWLFCHWLPVGVRISISWGNCVEEMKQVDARKKKMLVTKMLQRLNGMAIPNVPCGKGDQELRWQRVISRVALSLGIWLNMLFSPMEYVFFVRSLCFRQYRCVYRSEVMAEVRTPVAVFNLSEFTVPPQNKHSFTASCVLCVLPLFIHCCFGNSHHRSNCWSFALQTAVPNWCRRNQWNVPLAIIFRCFSV